MELTVRKPTPKTPYSSIGNLLAGFKCLLGTKGEQFSVLERVVSQAQSTNPVDHLSARSFRNAESVTIESATANATSLFGKNTGMIS